MGEIEKLTFYEKLFLLLVLREKKVDDARRAKEIPSSQEARRREVYL